MTINQLLDLLWNGTLETLYMTVISSVISYSLGVPLGVILSITSKNGICKCKPINVVLGFIVNVLRSVPFLILMVYLFPFTKIIVGTRIGTKATLVPLIVAAVPFVARLVESSLSEINPGVIEAASSAGASKAKIIRSVLLAEAKPSLIIGFAISITTILGYSGMAGFIGGGGLGAIAINYGYYRSEQVILTYCVIILVILVQVFQEIGMYVAKKLDNRISK